MLHPKDLLRHYGLEPKKSLGQNFLFDENVLRRIVWAADLQPEDSVLEVGPGLGALTRLLAETAVSVTAVELDDRLLPILQRELSPFPNITLIQGDILAQTVTALFPGPYKVVANVPYYITGAILRHLLDGQPKPSRLVLTVQKEVADRVTAVPPDMSLLAVSVQCYGRVQKVADIKAGSFWPTPEVDSAVIRVTLTDSSAMNQAPYATRFFQTVKVGFSQKRKQLQKNLRGLALPDGQAEAALQQAGIDGRRRAETLTLDEWHTLVRHLFPHD